MAYLPLSNYLCSERNINSTVLQMQFKKTCVLTNRYEFYFAKYFLDAYTHSRQTAGNVDVNAVSVLSVTGRANPGCSSTN